MEFRLKRTLYGHLKNYPLKVGDRVTSLSVLYYSGPQTAHFGGFILRFPKANFIWGTEIQKPNVLQPPTSSTIFL